MPRAERLVGVALKRDGKICGTPGMRAHYQIRDALGDEDPYAQKMGDTPGFMTDTGRFVSRAEATDIGVRSGQLGAQWATHPRELLSSDINWDA